MKAQGEIIVFILLSVIGITLLVSATLWSKEIFQKNIDIATVQSSEKFMTDLGDAIGEVIKFGGLKEIRYGMGGTISLIGSDTVELSIPMAIDIPETWINLSSDSSRYIRERLDKGNLVIQLVYPESDYAVQLFTEGTSVYSPEYITVEKNQTLSEAKTTIRIKVTLT